MMTELPDVAAVYPLVSVIVCTRNRADNVLYTAESLLASTYPNFELFIVDQSDDHATRDALAPLLKQSARLRYLKAAAPGKASSLNSARLKARGEYLALTDDDCEMEPNCLSALVAAFQADLTLGGIFGDVAAAPYDNTLEHIPEWRIREASTIRNARDFLKIPVRRKAGWLNFGMGANMALRAAALEEINGWDACIGPGEQFASGDDHNIAFRLLRAGHALHFCPDARVVHYGPRKLTHVGQDHQRVGRGFGASCIKYLRCGVVYHGSMRVLRFHLLKFASHCLRLRRSESKPFIRGWISGFIGGLRQPLNNKTLCFQKDEAAQKHSSGHRYAKVVLRNQQRSLIKTPSSPVMLTQAREREAGRREARAEEDCALAVREPS